MTRKRFIHLMMARGIQRNEAQHLAANVHRYGSYAQLYDAYRLVTSLPISISATIKAANKIVRRINTFIKAITHAWESACKEAAREDAQE